MRPIVSQLGTGTAFAFNPWPCDRRTSVTNGIRPRPTPGCDRVRTPFPSGVIVLLGGVNNVITSDIDSIFAKYPQAERAALIPILQDVQRCHGYLSRDAVVRIGKYLDLPSSKIYGVATFYNQFRFQPQGKFHVQVCRGTACHVRGSVRRARHDSPRTEDRSGPDDARRCVQPGSRGLHRRLRPGAGDLHQRHIPRQRDLQEAFPASSTNIANEPRTMMETKLLETVDRSKLPELLRLAIEQREHAQRQRARKRHSRAVRRGRPPVPAAARHV